ncbi:MAG TPA: prolipoprotein diacylglyceryl transferase family protein [Desulfobacteria bacterium]|nr:prolipoprotein diacylglyceryl transferase family protein [Desulfobacteria bacterium]
MIPYFPQPEYHLFGPFTIHAFGTIVAVAVIVGWQMVVRRARAKELDPELVQDLLSYVLLCGFVVAHLYSVLAYFPREAMQDPLLLLKFWQDISSFGGFAGGLLGLWLFFRFKARNIDATSRLRYLDVIAYVFPFAWAIGRAACTVAHDHPGTITSFPLGISLKSPEAQTYIAFFYREAGRLAELPPPAVLSKMAFHDLGWYEFLYMSCLMVPAFLALGRKPRPPGFFLIAFLLLYVPARFSLDFLRIGDARYLGLTPGQYAGIAVFLAAVFFMVRIGRREEKT